MSHDTPPIQDYITFEITVPSGKPDQLLALQAMATAFSLRTRERETLPSDLSTGQSPERWHVTKAMLRATSEELWGNEVYGETAAHRLGMYRRTNLKDREAIIEYADGETVYNRLWTTIADTIGLPTAELEDKVRHIWSLNNHPHEPRFTVPPKSTFEGYAGHYRLLVDNGAVTTHRLANYLRTSHLDNHGLHGTLGKAYDVMGVCSGVIRREDVGEADTPTLDFVDKTVFESQLGASDLSKTMQETIRQRLRYRTEYPRHDYYSKVSGEVVFEGLIKGRIYEKVALTSLAKLAPSFARTGTKSGKAAAEFLKKVTQ